MGRGGDIRPACNFQVGEAPALKLLQKYKCSVLKTQRAAPRPQRASREDVSCQSCLCRPRCLRRAGGWEVGSGPAWRGRVGPALLDGQGTAAVTGGFRRRGQKEWPVRENKRKCSRDQKIKSCGPLFQSGRQGQALPRGARTAVRNGFQGGLQTRRFRLWHFSALRGTYPDSCAVVL